ncbi:MAG: hypothetical protein DRN12_02010 [Thermoplasmata archaeon]|nr:MAG: hypothetical protein DRN12_02010 [Thermoplasmata archaeon]
MARRYTKIEPRGLAVTFAVFTLILVTVEAIYLILRMRDIILYPHSPGIPHWLEIGINVLLFSVLFFILFLSAYLSSAVVSKAKGYRRTAKLRLSDILPKSKYPTVTVAVFTFNEPVEMVKESIETNYFKLDYPREKLQLAVCDDSTEEKYWAPIAEYVEQLAKEGHKVFLIHRVVRKGRKAGAFNELINKYAETDYVAIADADYMFNPDFLEKTIPFFYTEENVFAVQTPQFFRNGDNTWISRLASNIQQWFYNFLGTFKDKDNAFFFCGTCGVIDLQKAKAVQMEEKAITEDLEMSTEAITKYGWVTLYVDEVMTSGVGPEMMGQLVGQYMRYSRGNLWSLRQHIADIILSNKMTLKQKIHYFHNNAALMMGVAMLLVLLEPFLFLFLDIAGPNIPIILTLLLFFMGNLNFYIVYGKSFREFMYHLFFMNVMSFKLTAQFIKGFILNSPGEFIRTAKISSKEKSIRKRIKYIFSLFWLEILSITSLWFILLFKTGVLKPDMFSGFIVDIQTQGIIDYILNYDIIEAINSFFTNSILWITHNPKAAGPILVFTYFTFWFIGGFYLTFIGGNKPTTARITEFVVPTKEDFVGANLLLREKTAEKEVEPIYIGSEIPKPITSTNVETVSAKNEESKTPDFTDISRPPSFTDIKNINEKIDNLLSYNKLRVENEEEIKSSIEKSLNGYKNLKRGGKEMSPYVVEHKKNVKRVEEPKDEPIEETIHAPSTTIPFSHYLQQKTTPQPMEHQPRERRDIWYTRHPREQTIDEPIQQPSPEKTDRRQIAKANIRDKEEDIWYSRRPKNYQPWEKYKQPIDLTPQKSPYEAIPEREEQKYMRRKKPPIE